MISAHYAHRLPADYDIRIIRNRASARGHLQSLRLIRRCKLRTFWNPGDPHRTLILDHPGRPRARELFTDRLCAIRFTVAIVPGKVPGNDKNIRARHALMDRAARS